MYCSPAAKPSTYIRRGTSPRQARSCPFSPSGTRGGRKVSALLLHVSRSLLGRRLCLGTEGLGRLDLSAGLRREHKAVTIKQVKLVGQQHRLESLLHDHFAFV